MIVCHCNVLKSCQIKEAISEALGQEEPGFINPGVVFRMLGCRPNCGTCMQHFQRLISEELKSQAVNSGQAEIGPERLVKS